VVWIPRKKKEESNAAQRGKYTAKQCIVKRTGKHSKGESKKKGHQENVQNLKKSMVGYRIRKSRYTLL